MKDVINNIAKKHNYDGKRLLNIFWDIQREYSYVSAYNLNILSDLLSISVPELRDTLTFYHFFHTKPAGKYQIYLDKSVVGKMNNSDEIRQEFEKELGIKVGEVTADGKIGLFTTNCIGMSDQAPAALVAGRPIGNLTKNKVKNIIRSLKHDKIPTCEVKNTVQHKGPVFFTPYTFGKALKVADGMTPNDILEEIDLSNLRGRGGAGFSTGMKWKYCASQSEPTKYVICNADEGEPGTFKDRFLLTKKFPMLIEGMTIAAKAIGAKEGIIYLRAEYQYLLPQIETQIAKYQKTNFPIRVQLGAGAYVVGEETALLESLEGKRGEPRVRPPFPVEQGYLGKPTIVNNVETFCAVTKIIENGALWYVAFGTERSSGTKLLSVSGDCKKPGQYEVEWGLTIGEFIEMVHAENPMAIQVGGPSGQCIDAKDKDRIIAFEDLPTGGSMIVIGKKRNLLKIVRDFTKFFVAESCGCCTPCRAGSIVLKEQMDHILAGAAAASDLKHIKEWSKIIEASSRCGLGQTCANPITSTIQNFPQLYNSLLGDEKLFRPFDVDEKVKNYNDTVKKYE